MIVAVKDDNVSDEECQKIAADAKALVEGQIFGYIQLQPEALFNESSYMLASYLEVSR